MPTPQNGTMHAKQRSFIGLSIVGIVILTSGLLVQWLFHPAYPHLPYQKITRYGCFQSGEGLGYQEESYEVLFSFDGNTVELFYKDQRETMHWVETDTPLGHGLTWRGSHFEYFDNAEHYLYGPNGFALTPTCG